MKKKKLTIYDATKEELIQYFFCPELPEGGGGYRIQASKDQFLIWLNNKRSGELFNSIDAAISASKEAFESYIELVRRANEEKDVEKKIAILDQASKAYDRYEKANRAYDRLNKKVDEMTV